MIGGPHLTTNLPCCYEGTDDIYWPIPIWHYPKSRISWFINYQSKRIHSRTCLLPPIIPRSEHGSLVHKNTLTVFVSEGEVLRFELAELLGALLQLLGMFVELLLHALDF